MAPISEKGVESLITLLRSFETRTPQATGDAGPDLFWKETEDEYRAAQARWLAEKDHRQQIANVDAARKLKSRNETMNMEAVADHIVTWLEAYRRRSGLKGFVVGISGGVDSAVTSILCARTGSPVLALNLPIRQDPAQFSLAAAHIRWLAERFPNVEGWTCELTAVFNAFETILPPEVQDGLTMANTRSRIRMTALYAFAGHHRLLVTGTGNKVEDFGVGFFTKYGDGGVDICPIADLMKSEVRALARHFGVLEDIVAARPTDGLWDDNRTDEEQIGASYDELEWAMNVIEKTGCDEAALSPRQKEVLAVFRRFHEANRHKMEPLPVAKIPKRF